MNNLGFVDKTDKYRTLLTEVLPYETPLWFTNDFFYTHCKNKEINKLPECLKVYIDLKKLPPTERIPLSYRIKKDTTGERELSIMHPGIQLKVVEFYEKYKDLLIYYCNKEKTSLRKPVKVAGRFITDKNQNQNETIGVEEEISERESCSSYFIYDKVGFIYKFYESYEFHSLEKKYSFLIKLDIARCFNHIYTHSISWAAKSKGFVKENLKPGHRSFADDFDNLMQSSNYRETNGILIGPEVSRIFAEIILQKIDQNIIKDLESKNISYKKDFEIRRYVDDYFIFYKSPIHETVIVESIDKSLEFYRLYTNDKKKELLERPFISDLTMCKKELLELINTKYGAARYNNSKDKLKDSDPSNEKANVLKNISIYRIDKVANSFIVDIKMILKKYNVKYKSITGFLLSCFRRKLEYFTKQISDADPIQNESEIDLYKSWLLVDIDVIFFVYAMDFRVRPTIIIARIIQSILNVCSNKNCEIDSLIIKKIFDGGNTVLRNHEALQNQSRVEILNLILVLSRLGEDFFIAQDRLIEIFFPKEKSNNSSLSYFEWVTLMLLSKNLIQYTTLHSKLTDGAMDRFKNETWHLGDTEKFMFTLDLLSCPYIDKPFKREVLSTLKNEGTNIFTTEQKMNQAINTISKNTWFVDWKDDKWFEKRLIKKEYTFPYS